MIKPATIVLFFFLFAYFWVCCSGLYSTDLISVFFLGGGIVHLFFLIRLGSIPSGIASSDSTGKKKSKLKVFFGYLFSALVYASLTFVFKLIGNKELSPEYILFSLKTSLITAVIWIILFAALVSAIGYLSSRRTEKMIKEAEHE